MNNASDSCRSVRLSPIHLAGAAVFLPGLSCTAQAADTLPSYPELLVDNVKHVLTAPARWQEQEWQNLGLAAIGVIGVAAILDRPVRYEKKGCNYKSRYCFSFEWIFLPGGIYNYVAG